MTEWGIADDESVGQNFENAGPKPLRDAYEAQKAKTQELQEAVASLQAELKGQKVGATLAELGLPAAAASQYQGEADPEKVREWANNMKALFGNGSPNPTPTATPVTPPAPTQTLSDDQMKQMQNFADAGQEGKPLGNFEAMAGRIGDAKSITDLLQGWQNFPG